MKPPRQWILLQNSVYLAMLGMLDVLEPQDCSSAWGLLQIGLIQYRKGKWTKAHLLWYFQQEPGHLKAINRKLSLGPTSHQMPRPHSIPGLIQILDFVWQHPHWTIFLLAGFARENIPDMSSGEPTRHPDVPLPARIHLQLRTWIFTGSPAVILPKGKHHQALWCYKEKTPCDSGNTHFEAKWLLHVELSLSLGFALLPCNLQPVF